MTRVFLSCALALLFAVPSRGGTAPPAPQVYRQGGNEIFAKGAKEFESVTGVFYFFDRGDNDGPSVDLAVESLRFGLMLTNPRGSGFFAGNYEFLAEVFGAPIFQGVGNITAGATLFIRYNFIQPGGRVTPYMQIGGGGVYTDISEHESRGLVSLPVEFNLQGTGGLRFMVDRHWSILLEAGYRHISNATITLPNRGIDSVGGDIGAAFSF